MPHDLSAKDLIKALKKFDYEPTRQVGSHIRITTHTPSEHHVTIPAHSPLKIGTLAAILDDIATHLNIDKQHLIKKLFG